MIIDGKHEGPKRIYKGSLPYPGLVVTRALGDSVASRIGVLSEPFVKVYKLEAQDFFLILGSDGLWDGIGIQEACAVVLPYLEMDVSLASTILNDAGLAGLDKIQVDDNITNIIVRLS
jgi:serine/threonine protein phosphatase PrpC